MSLRFLHLHGNTFVLYSLYMELLKDAMPWIQTILSVVLIGLILLQRSGAELGGAFGGGDAGGGVVAEPPHDAT